MQVLPGCTARKTQRQPDEWKLLRAPTAVAEIVTLQRIRSGARRWLNQRKRGCGAQLTKIGIADHMAKWTREFVVNRGLKLFVSRIYYG